MPTMVFSHSRHLFIANLRSQKSFYTCGEWLVEQVRAERLDALVPPQRSKEGRSLQARGASTDPERCNRVVPLSVPTRVWSDSPWRSAPISSVGTESVTPHTGHKGLMLGVKHSNLMVSYEYKSYETEKSLLNFLSQALCDTL